MEFIKSSVHKQVLTNFNYLKRDDDSYFRREFWQSVESELIRGRNWGAKSDFSFYAQIFIGNIVDKILVDQLEAFIKHATTPPYSIGEYWLNKQAPHIEFGVKMDLTNVWKAQAVAARQEKGDRSE